MARLSEFDLDLSVGRTPSWLGVHYLRESLNQSLENEWVDLYAETATEKLLFWPSTLRDVERKVGGLYGMTVLTGSDGTGKTTILRASSVAAAAAGWQVFVFLAEDSMNDWRAGFNRYVSTHPGSELGLENMQIAQVGRNQSPESLTEQVCERADVYSECPILIAIDSVNSVVNLGGGDYLSRLGSFGVWAMLARRLSRGRCSFMLNSEVNARGSAKGGGLAYWSDVHLKLEKKADSVAVVELKKSRLTAGEGVLGKYGRVWAEACFVPKSELLQRELAPVQPDRHLELVGGTDTEGDPFSDPTLGGLEEFF